MPIMKPRPAVQARPVELPIHKEPPVVAPQERDHKERADALYGRLVQARHDIQYLFSTTRSQYAQTAVARISKELEQFGE